MLDNKNKKAQIAEGITWVVATVAIIIILLFSIFATSLYVSKTSSLSIESLESSLSQKSFFSYLLTKENNEEIYFSIKNQEKFNDFNGNLALKILRDLYKNDYKQIWVGVSSNDKGTGLKEQLVGSNFIGIENKFFGKKPSLRASGALGALAYKDAYSVIAYLKEKRYIEAIFVK